ncbi:MAG: DNA mismatch repair protein MutS, partial [Polyangiaceae bacterium]|nr:DNA mismatch repair protein MutS [Polyangiaceae bacterium]
MLAAVRVRYDALAWSRLAAIIGAIATVVATVWIRLGAAGWFASSLLFATFGALVVFHGRVATKRDRLLAARLFNQRGKDRLEGKWTEFKDDGAQYLNDNHAFALDLDIFGKSSLYQLLNDTRTAKGAQQLADCLVAPWPTESIQSRQQSVKELSAMLAWRESLSVAGTIASETQPDPEPLLAWGERTPTLNASKGFIVAACAASLLPIVAAIASIHPSVPNWFFLLPCILNMATTFALSKKLEPIITAVSDRSSDLERHSEMLELIEKQNFTSDGLVATQDKLRSSGLCASAEIRKLARIVSILDARRNGAFRAVIGPALLWDLRCVFALERWQSRVGPSTRQWVQALADVEATSSLAAFGFENPNYAFPEIGSGSDIGRLHFDAKGLGHPLISNATRVINDVSMPGPGSVMLVTGSNMSGKSTLLRSIGVAAVLALAGAPVCAKELKISWCVVRTSMRVSDSLKDGISRFYAELLKLKLVTQTAQHSPVLFLLDEILHGTNSRERHVGALSIIKNLINAGAIGAVSTHDLALASLADQEPTRLSLVHLQEQVHNGKMVFDYKLREGVVKSGNALRWMQQVGLPVDDTAQPQ